MRRSASLLALVLAPLLGVGLAPGVPAAGASPARPHATAVSTDASVLEPTPACTTRDDPGKGVDTTVFGYVNHSSSRVHLEPGTWNLLLGTSGVKVPTVFEPGRHPHAFEVPALHGTSVRWELGSGEAIGPGARCKGRLSPALAGSIMRGAVAGGLPLAFVFFVFAIKRRRDRKQAPVAA